MSTLAKLLLLPAVLVAGVVGVALAADGPPSFTADPIAAAGDTTATTASTETGARVDISGPCDEVEHANDPRCAGVTVPRAAAGVGGVDISGPCDEVEHANDPRCAGVTVPRAAAGVGGVDISGPCDEAEHANDPRCTGAAGARSDNSGPGSAHSGRGPDDDGGEGGGRGRGGDSD
jgi:hypothetical protein